MLQTRVMPRFQRMDHPESGTTTILKCCADLEKELAGWLWRLGTSPGKIMARKTISTGTCPATQLLRELEVCQLDHPNIVHFYGAYLYSQSDSSEVNFLMEYCEGGSFDAIMRQLRIHSPGIRIAERVQARLAREVLQGLDFIHSKSLIHRDIKPSNILVTKGGVAKICDFGVSGVLEASLASTFTGTSWYMAPERISGHTYSIRADVWSLGITFLELALHRFPYPDDLGPIELVTYIYNGEAPVLTDEPASDGHGEIVWSDEMKEFIKQCLCKDAAARPRPRDLLKHPWILADIDRDVDMAEFIREVWGWPETTK
ncbi:Pkinase-domain-containing protein, partial [Ceratobasidium sp. AG-I]